MKVKSRNKTILELIEFQQDANNRNLVTYAVTLTYYDYIKHNGKWKKVKLPSQKDSINIDMKNFKDNISKYYKRRNIHFECFFIYCKYNDDSTTRPHFHGIIALSQPKRIKDIVQKYWKRGYVFTNLIYDFGWVTYIIKNILESSRFYESNQQIKSRTNKKTNSSFDSIFEKY